MPFYWAQFKTRNKRLWRFDTRIYLHNVDECNNDDILLGAIVAKNPGTALPLLDGGRGLQPINLGADDLLPKVKSVVTRAHAAAKLDLPLRGFIQVLNLFYLREPVYSTALAVIRRCRTHCFCASETASFPWIWYAWGGAAADLPDLAARFRTLKTKNHFCHDKLADRVVAAPPAPGSWARHTQGLHLAPLTAHLTKVLLSLTR